MDYDQTNMPENYDRGRTQPPGVLDMWMDRLATALSDWDPISSIVDLGCGTGRFSNALAERFDANVIGVDPSEKMLAQAKAKPAHPQVTYVKGMGENIPVPSASADVIFASMSFHHFDAPDRAAQECFRVLRQGGVVCIRNSTRENDSPFELYFPNYRLALDTLPAAAEIVAPFVRNGFTLSSHQTVAHKMAESVSDLADRAVYRADTTLQRLSDEDFAQGLDNMRAATRTSNGPAMIGVALFVFARGKS